MTCPFVHCTARVPGVTCCAPPRVARWQPCRCRWAWPLAGAIVVWALAQVAVAWAWRDDSRDDVVMIRSICGQFVPEEAYARWRCLRDPNQAGRLGGSSCRPVSVDIVPAIGRMVPE